MAVLQLASSAIGMAEAGRLPDSVVRFGMRNLIRKRRRQIRSGSLEQRSDQRAAFIDQACAGPVAEVPEKANEQHYEVPAELFVGSLGRHLKYSCCYWDAQTTTLDQAEANALQRTCSTADLIDGQNVLELGCGWGSLSLWMAEHYPNSQITSVSNSGSQREYIEAQARQRGLSNLQVVTCDVNDFQAEQKFDRVVSVEMFEHVRNHRLLMNRIASWLNDGGKLFVHIFCHARESYLFEDEGASSWMARNFFSGGMMPSRDLLLNYQDDLTIEKHIEWDGQHYEKTANAWVETMDRNSEQIADCLKQTYGDDWKKWRQRWRMFYMACAELFGFDGGREWYVSHYVFRKPTES